MKLNWAERWAVNNPARVFEQRLEINALHRVAALRPGSTVLEIGAGRGAGAEIIIEKFKPSRLHLMDLDREMVIKARKRLAASDHPPASACVADVLRLPYSDAMFDAVFGFGVLHHVPDWRGGLAEIARVLKTSGCYFFEELYPSLYQNFITRHILLHPTGNRFKSEDWKAALRQQNFKVIKTMEQKMLGILGAAVKE